MSSIFSKLFSRSYSRLQSHIYGRKQNKYFQDLSFTDACKLFSSRNELYAYMHHYYYNLCPKQVTSHRSYFAEKARGFGEEAFHSMWFTLLREFRPKKCLEIGVYRGQSISLWALIAKQLDFPTSIHGISPFTPAGDQVSEYLKSVNYQNDTLENHQHFVLPLPTLLKAFSTDTNAINHISGQQWDLIYIDGNHDYEVALADYILCKDSLAKGGLLVMDDSSLYTDFVPPVFSFAGHPGPSRVVQERAMKEMLFLGGVGHNNVFQKI